MIAPADRPPLARCYHAACIERGRPTCARHCLSRRSFHQGLLAAAVVALHRRRHAKRWSSRAISLVVPADAPRTVALTLDACSGATDMRIVETLIALSVPATIFASGLWLRGQRTDAGADARARRPVQRCRTTASGICRRCWARAACTACRSPARWRRSGARSTRGADLVAEARGERPRWYRGAAGLYSPRGIRAIQAMGCRSPAIR